jgi:hypothetical protein
MAKINVKYTLSDEHQAGPTVCFECDKWIAAGDGISVIVETHAKETQPLLAFLHKACAKKVGLIKD